jgi:hypothetical protein
MLKVNREIPIMEGQATVGRFSVEFVVANYRDVAQAAPGTPIPEGVKHVVLRGVVDSGAAQLVLPQSAANELQLQVEGEIMVRYADQLHNAVAASARAGRHPGGDRMI